MLYRQVDGDNNDEVLLPGRKQYYICYNLKKMIDKKPTSSSNSCNNLNKNRNSSKTSSTSSTIAQPKTSTNKQNETNNKEVLSCILDSASISRSAWLKKRNGESIDHIKLSGINTVKVLIEGDEDEVINIKHNRISQKEKFYDDVTDKFYRIPFGKLTMKQRRQRMRDIAKVVISACIDRTEYKNNKDEYLFANKELGIDVLNLIDGMK
jgi:hypothetical protein